MGARLNADRGRTTTPLQKRAGGKQKRTVPGDRKHLRQRDAREWESEGPVAKDGKGGQVLPSGTNGAVDVAHVVRNSETSVARCGAVASESAVRFANGAKTLL